MADRPATIGNSDQGAAAGHETGPESINHNWRPNGQSNNTNDLTRRPHADTRNRPPLGYPPAVIFSRDM